MLQRRLVSLLSVTVVLSMLLSACGGEAAPTATPVTQPTSAPTDTAAAAAPTNTEAAAATTPSGSTGGQMYVGFVPPALTSPFHVAMADGATAKAKELGWKIDVQAP